jgi:ribonucleotide monophosphatase NagD (HAD superfamily)
MRVLGKPSAILLAYIWKQFGDIAPQRTVFVGDRLDTDVVFANKAGMPSCLVLTGCSSLKDVEESGVAVPTFVAQSLGDFVGVHNAN